MIKSLTLVYVRYLFPPKCVFQHVVYNCVINVIKFVNFIVIQRKRYS